MLCAKRIRELKKQVFYATGTQLRSFDANQVSLRVNFVVACINFVRRIWITKSHDLIKVFR